VSTQKHQSTIPIHAFITLSSTVFEGIGNHVAYMEWVASKDLRPTTVCIKDLFLYLFVFVYSKKFPPSHPYFCVCQFFVQEKMSKTKQSEAKAKVKGGNHISTYSKNKERHKQQAVEQLSKQE
jgi:hypothetical protein